MRRFVASHTSLPAQCLLLSVLFALLGLNPGRSRAEIFTRIDPATFAPGVNLGIPAGGYGGLIFADLNNDGYMDMVALNGYNASWGPTVLRNTFPETGKVQFAEEAGALPPNEYGRYPTGLLAVGDVDNDGDIDIFASDDQSGTHGIWLWENNLHDNGVDPQRTEAEFSFTLHTVGGTTFEFGSAGDMTSAMGIAVGDFDTDGDLDVVFDDSDINAGTKRFFLNRIGAGEFKFVETTITDTHDQGADLSAIDINMDGLLDLMSRAQAQSNNDILYLNRIPTEGAFQDAVSLGAIAFLPTQQSATTVGEGYGTAWGDYDNDGDWDVLIQNRYEEDTYATRFYVAQSPTAFNNQNDVSAIGVEIESVTGDGGGVVFGDVDNDGDLDLFVGAPFWAGKSDKLYLNVGDTNGDGVWEFEDQADVETDITAYTTDDTEAVALVDWDNDGDLDLYVHNSDADDAIFENQTSSSATADNFLRVRVTCANRDCVGAVVQVFHAGDLDGDRIPDAYRPGYPGAPMVGDINYGVLSTTIVPGSLVGTRQVSGGMGIGAQDSFILHFGIPDPDAYYTIRVLFPGGDKVVLKDVQPSSVSGTFRGVRLSQFVTITGGDTSEDGDGLPAFLEEQLGTSPTDLDSDDDGITDNDEYLGFHTIISATGKEIVITTDPANPDTDGDGIWDGAELGATSGIPDMDGSDGLLLATDTTAMQIDADPFTQTDPTDADTDGDGLVDGYSTVLGMGEDANQNGRYDENTPPGEPVETNPLDIDTDDDGISDGSEVIGYDVNGATYTSDPRSHDSDSDSLPDGLEIGLTEPEYETPVDPTYDLKGTDTTKGLFKADADAGATTTDPNDEDTDDDGVVDGVEDFNKNGQYDGAPNETDPTKWSTDAGCDSDGTEAANGTDPRDPSDDSCSDMDGDGLTNLEEADLGTDPENPDTDGDGLSDGLEVSTSLTDPNKADTDEDGLWDGYDSQGCGEDRNGNGVVDPDETDPNNEDTDGDLILDGKEDYDRDCIRDSDESDPLDMDTDDDGLSDGEEDTNHNGVLEQIRGETKAYDPDSDGDGLPDGLESGVVTPTAGTDLDAGHFYPDQDPSTTTDPNDPDSDNDELLDGQEDTNADGAKNADETDPNDRDTDDDNCSDGREVNELGTDPLVKDTDGDGLEDCIEDTTYGTSPTVADTDGDALSDGDEVNVYTTNPTLPDSDSDGLTDGEEVSTYGTDPLNRDSDNDTLWDGEEVHHPTEATDPLSKDTDNDGIRDDYEVQEGCALDATNPDTDGDSISDGVEDSNNKAECVYEPWLGETDPLDADTDDDGFMDGEEDTNLDGTVDAGETDPRAADTDGDGLQDGTELGLTLADIGADTDTDVFVPDTDPGSRTDPLAADTDGDTLGDGEEDANRNGSWDSDLGETDPLSADSDSDGLEDAEEYAEGTDPLNPDTDGGCELDGSEVDGGRNPVDDPADDNCADADNDGIANDVETSLFHSNPEDADTDDDGVIDGLEPGLVDTNGDGLIDGWAAGKEDVDGDGLNSVLDPDSDDDGLLDAVELGLYSGQTLDGFEVPHPDTDLTRGRFQEDADQGATTTDPLLADTDGGGADDGAEDPNHNGRVDENELDPGDSSDDPEVTVSAEGCYLGTAVEDSDCDGLTDLEEAFQNSGRKAVWVDPNDADTDDDGVLDGDEDNWTVDMDGDGLIDVRDVDSDNDGILDGTEKGISEDDVGPDTDLTRGVFVADVDPLSVTSMVNRDTDFGGADDGAEDPNHDGAINLDEGPEASVSDDMLELDPNDPSDDPTPSPEGTTINCEGGTFVFDADCDGLTDREEYHEGSNRVDADTDDDGLKDGDEDNWRVDTHLDGMINANDCDSDSDLILDGTERGVTSRTSGTDGNECYKVDDDATTVTVMIDADTDGGLVLDGTEDANQNGRIDVTGGTPETDPNDPADDCEDSDSDGLCNYDEEAAHTDPRDADSDDDGILDSDEGIRTSPWNDDYDGDGLINALDPDSDNDGVLDGTEVGLTASSITEDVEGRAATNLAAGFFVADADPLTKTNPCLADTDDDGADDGAEDPNHNGRVDDGELDPNEPDAPPAAPADAEWKCNVGTAVADFDCDGLTDAEESAFGTDPSDIDSDDDGVLDGDEHNWSCDMDFDGFIDALDEDSDGDLVLDGTEMGLTSDAILIDVGGNTGGTDLEAGNFVPDEDPSTTTYMVLDNSDWDEFNEGEEDCNLNGAVDCVDTDPNDPDDPGEMVHRSLCNDLDGDGLSDFIEETIGTDPLDPDSDGDGLTDLIEQAWDECSLEPVDTDGDGTIDALDEDSDDDTLPDAVEAGDDPSDPADTDEDGIPDYLDLDSDGDTLSDEEEVNTYGTDPADPDTDGGGVADGVEVYEHFTSPLIPEDDNTAIRGGGCSSSGRSSPAGPLTGLLIGLLVAVPAWRFRREARTASETRPRSRWQRRGGLLFFLIATTGLALLAPRAAEAQSNAESRFSAQNFRPALDMGSFFSVWDSSILHQWHFNAGVSASYAYRPLVRRSLDDGAIRQDIVGMLTTGEVYGGLGLTDFIAIHLSFPVSYGTGYVPVATSDTITIPSSYEEFATLGYGDAWAALKLQLLNPRKSAVGLALIPEISYPIGPKDYFFNEPSYTVRLRAAADMDLGFLRAGFNVGYRVRSRIQVQDILLDDMGEIGAAVKIPLIAGLDVTAEGYGSFVARSFSSESFTGAIPFSRTGTSPLELLGGLHYTTGFGLLAFAGGGAGLNQGVGAPTYRFFFGMGYRSPLNLDEDGDGVPDRFDKCPKDPENFNGVMDEDGCPEPDTDGDTIVDPVDACPTAPEDFDGFQDEDGCPDLDNDGDGIPDVKDRCPDDPEDKDGYQDSDGCPDADNDQDGILDDADRCPNQMEDFDNFEDEDGCPETDNDGDGILDSSDQCPNDPEDKDSFEDADGCPDPDNDGDGIPDAVDECPNEAEVINGVDDEDGCPDEGTQMVFLKEDRLVTLFPVHFEVDRAIIRADSETLLKQVAATLKVTPFIKKLRIEGHTDSDGSEEYNLALSQARAEAVRDFLIREGIDPNRLEAVGYGESRPIASNKTPAGKEKNRRVDFIIVEREQHFMLKKKDGVIHKEEAPVPAPTPMPTPAPDSEDVP